jgi:AmiR/NasT family two-component response regulator
MLGQDTRLHSSFRLTPSIWSYAVDRTHHLRVLIANQRADRLELLARVVIDLGHDVIAREINVAEVGAVTGRERPDVALVGLGESSDHALELITEIVRGAFCPVIALLEAYDAEWVDQAAQRGVYAYIVDTRPEELQSAIDITLRRFAEFQSVQGAFERRSAEILRETELTLSRRRQVLELYDGVVQELAVAHLALELDRREESRDAILGALENARAIVGRSLDELQGDGVSIDQLVKDAAPH